MRIKALLIFLTLATALTFFHREEKIAISYSQEEVSPLQPAATMSAEELQKLEEGGLKIPIDTEGTAVSKGFIPLRYRLLSWKILGVKIIPLFAALTTMLILSAIVSAVREVFLTEEPVIVNNEDEPKKISQSEKSAATNKTVRKKRGRPPKKRPRGRPRKSITA